jgi:hypothetical protein
LLSDDEEIRTAKSLLNRVVMAIVASALSLASAVLLTAGSAPLLHGVQIINLLGAVGLFFGVLLLLRLVVQVIREGG